MGLLSTQTMSKIKDLCIHGFWSNYKRMNYQLSGTDPTEISVPHTSAEIMS